MERQRIRVVTLNDLARAAVTAQRELGLCSEAIRIGA